MSKLGHICVNDKFAMRAIKNFIMHSISGALSYASYVTVLIWMQIYYIEHATVTGVFDYGNMLLKEIC